MDKILHDPKDPKLWELWYIPWVMQDFVHQPYVARSGFGAGCPIFKAFGFYTRFRFRGGWVQGLKAATLGEQPRTRSSDTS